MMAHQFALVKREIWEHRSIWITPAAIAFILTLLVVAGAIMTSAFGEEWNPDFGRIADATVPDGARRAILGGVLVTNGMLFLMAMWFVTIFYCLDALYAERKDRSILFWRSLPITDAETVISKLLTAFIAIPVITMAGIMVSHLLNLIIMSIWLGFEGANPFRFIWSAVPLFDSWTAVFIYLLAVPIWVAPLLGWFLLISSWAKGGPFLRAVMPIAVLPILEYIVFRSWNLLLAIAERLSLNAMPIYDIGRITDQFDEDDLHDLLSQDVSMTSLLDVSKFLTSGEVWAGLVICGVFVTGAIYMRRYREDS